jgi:hypothetical protein
VSGSKSFILFRHSWGAWCAAPPGFRDLLLDPVGLGETRIAAVGALLRHPEFVQRSSKGEWPQYVGLSAFIEVVVPECAEFVSGKSHPDSSQDRAERRRKLFRVVLRADKGERNL